MYYSVFKPYEQKLLALSTERTEGVSEGPYASLNVCDYTGDSAQHVHQNRLLFCRCHGIEPSKLILPHQTHGDQVRLIDGDFFKRSETDQSEWLNQVDALICSEPNICLGIQTADCVPVLLYDPVVEAIGVAHCGWRGTVAHLAAKCALEMKEAFGCQMDHLKVALGPSITVLHYKVGEELIDTFEQAGFPIGLVFYRHADTLAFHLDLQKANCFVLKQIGVKPENIETCNRCSFSDNHYFSARRDGIHSGRTLSALMLRSR